MNDREPRGVWFKVRRTRDDGSAWENRVESSPVVGWVVQTGCLGTVILLVLASFVGAWKLLTYLWGL